MQVRFLPEAQKRVEKLFSREEFGDFCFAAGCGVLFYEFRLERLVYRLVCRREGFDIAFLCGACRLEAVSHSSFARVVKTLFAQALAMGFFGAFCNCHPRSVLYIGMIGKLTGRFDGVAEGGQAIVEVGGVGYTVRMPAGALSSLGGGVGGTLTLFIHTAVREDAIDLYGFLSEEELSFFKQLMSVSGIGPKSALNILNVSDVQTLKRGIAGGNAASLTKVFGIGKKSAERIVVELRDKVVLGTPGSAGTAAHGDDAELVEALLALGYSANESRQAVKAVPPLGSVNERLAAALKAL